MWRGPNPAATVYESIGSEFFLALDEGWLNLGLWEGDGAPSEAPAAVRRLVSTLAADLPRGGTILDVGNGLGAQEPLIAEIARPRRLLALNVTESQLRQGRSRLEEADAVPIGGDATRIPLADASVDGVISVEAAFHFPSRAMFFREARRVLRPGGVLTMSDVPVRRLPRSPAELLAGLVQLRIWGLRLEAAASAERIAGLAGRAGFADVRTELVGDRVIPPVLAFARRRLESFGRDVPAPYRLACRAALAQVELLWDRGVLDYLLLRARVPD